MNSGETISVTLSIYVKNVHSFQNVCPNEHLFLNISDESKTADEGHLLLCLLAEVNLRSCVHVTNWGVKWLLDSIVPVATTALCRVSIEE